MLEELESDPDMFAVRCAETLNFAEAKRAFDRNSGDEKALDAWKGSKLMDYVVQFTFDKQRGKL